jgi:hypothetical protein
MTALFELMRDDDLDIVQQAIRIMADAVAALEAAPATIPEPTTNPEPTANPNPA